MSRAPRRTRFAAAVAAVAVLTVGTAGAAWAAPVDPGRRTGVAPPSALGAAAADAAAGTGTAAPVVARTAKSPVGVTLGTLEPRAPAGGPTSPVRAAGQLRSQGSSTVTDIRVELLFGRTAVSSRGALDEQLREAALPATIPTLPPATLVASKELAGQLRPGGPALAFDLTAPGRLGELADDSQLAVHPLEVVVTGTVLGQSGRVAAVGTYVVYLPAAVKAPTPLTVVIPIADRPRLGLNGVLLDDTLATATGRRGRLGRLLAAATAAAGKRSTVALAVDPALLDALGVMLKPYQVAGRPGTTSSKPASANAREFLAGLKAFKGTVVPLPYADADLVALTRAGRITDVQRMLARGRSTVQQAIGRPPETTVAIPAAGAVDQATLTVLARNGIRTLVLDEASMPRNAALTYTPTAVAALPTAVGTRRALVGDSGLTHLMSAVPGAAALPRAAEQVVLAETAMMTADAPNMTRPAVVTLPRDWNPPGTWAARIIGDLSAAPWLAPTDDLARVATGTPAGADQRGKLVYPLGDRRSELPGPLLDSVAQLRGSVEDFCGALRSTAAGAAVGGASLTGATGGTRDSAAGCPAGLTGEPGTAFDNVLTAPLELAMDRAESASWRPFVAGAYGFVGTVQREFDALRGKVTIVTSRAVTLTSRSGRVPLTLQNDLAEPIRVRLVLSAPDRTRLRSDAVVERTLQIGDKVQVEVEVVAEAAGTFPVDLTLQTPTGQPLSVGPPHRVLVRSTAYGVIATAITGSAVGVLLLAVLVRLVRRVRRASAARRGRHGAPKEPAV